MKPVTSCSDFLNESLFDKPTFASMSDIFTYKQPHVATIAHELMGVVMNERRISEKAFEAQNNLKEELEAVYAAHPEMLDDIERFRAEGKRNAYCAEYLYDTYLRK